MSTKSKKRKLIVLGMDGAVPYIFSEAMSKGLLPNFSRLARMGVMAKVMPHPSGVTPGNWAHISTGALQWTTGISEFSLHRVGQPLEGLINAFPREECHAEPIWETLAARGLRAATISFPVLPNWNSLRNRSCIVLTLIRASFMAWGTSVSPSFRT